MIWNLLRLAFIAWVIYTAVKWYNRWRAFEKKRAYEAGRAAERQRRQQGGGSSKASSMNSDNLGEYVDYEEVKD